MEEAMHRIDSATLRRLVPAFAVGGVLAFSLIASVPSLASNGGSGYGYGNNCGVKGTGYHDHGKVCPNRPFPGQGVTEAAGNSETTAAAADTTTPGNSDKATKSISTTATSSTDENASSTSKGHGHGNGKAKGHGRGNGHN
jgi:hypothetical protein